MAHQIAWFTAMDSLHFWCTGFLKPEWNHQSGWFKTLFESSYISCIFSIPWMFAVIHILGALNSTCSRFFHLYTQHTHCLLCLWLPGLRASSSTESCHIHYVNPACVPQATCFSTQFHLFSLFLVLCWAGLNNLNTAKAHDGVHHSQLVTRCFSFAVL